MIFISGSEVDWIALDCVIFGELEIRILWKFLGGSGRG